MISTPMSILFGPGAIEYRLNNSGAAALITDSANYEKIKQVRANCPELKHVFVIDGQPEDTLNWWNEIDKASDEFTNVKTKSTDPAFINYTSGTTGLPKGTLAPHSSMIGHMAGFEFGYDFFPQEGDIIWSPADWAWLAGQMDILMVGWCAGVPVAASPKGGFDPEDVYRFMAQHKVRVTLLTPTMLKIMRQVEDPLSRYDLKLRVIGSGSEAVGKELYHWAQGTLKVVLNEGFGQTELNGILGNNASVMPIKPGSLGRPMPGHTKVGIINDKGEELGPHKEGHIAAKKPHPMMLLEYWRDPKATEEKFIGDWMITGDLGHKDEDDYYWFHGRSDDVISSAGYRIGPGEIEDELLKHPAVGMSAAIGKPDPTRGEIVKAFIMLAPGYKPSGSLKEEIREFIKTHLSKHEYPKEIEFIDQMPLTPTGKIVRRELRQQEIDKMK
jgi:acetyl-CoA synthetase